MSADQPKESALRDASDARKATALERIEAVIAWIERGELLPGPGVGPDLEDWKTIAAALATLPGQTSALRDDQVRDALAELVACKDLAERMTQLEERQHDSTDAFRAYKEIRAECERRVPAAWGPARRALAATRPAEPDIDAMVNRFLGWRLPDDFAPDAGISFTRVYNEASPFGPSSHEPIGTNLFNAVQARAMLEHALGIEQARSASTLPPADERAAFDAWWAQANSANCDQWGAWQARAALRPSAAPEPAALTGVPPVDPSWRDMASAPLDNTLVRLLVKFDNHGIEDTAEPTATIGAHNDGEWNFVGWNWYTDEWTRGSGDLLGWLPMLGQGHIEAANWKRWCDELEGSAAAPAIEPAAEPESHLRKWRRVIEGDAATGMPAASEVSDAMILRLLTEQEIPAATMDSHVSGTARELVGVIQFVLARLRPTAALAAPPDSSVHPAGLAPAPSSTVRAKGGA